MARRALRAVFVALTLTAGAHAGPNDVVALPAASEQEPGSVPDAGVEAQLPRLDQLVNEAVQDLGLTLALEARGAREVPSEEELVERAQQSWVVLPTLRADGRALRLRIVAIRPGSRVLLTRSERFSVEDMDVRVAVMMRDLVRPQDNTAAAARVDQPEPANSREPRSSGRAVLALNAAVFGGYVGYSIQAASGSSDERLVYPLVALGAGVGLGASMLVADEWDVSVGGAWFLSAGLWWPTSAGLLLTGAYDVPKEDRYVYGVVSGTGGVALAVAAMSLSDISEGDAVLAHSGGVLGMGLGGLAQLFVEGSTGETPVGGMGYGAALGTLGAGLLATQIDARASRVLLIDLGATLGALTGAAAASPLLLVDEAESKPRTRLWLGSIFAGSLVGAGIGWWSTAKADTPRQAAAGNTCLPYALATPEARGARFEAGLLGRF
jgi:hypothetical protein